MEGHHPAFGDESHPDWGRVDDLLGPRKVDQITLGTLLNDDRLDVEYSAGAEVARNHRPAASCNI